MNLQQIVGPLLFWYDDHARILPWRENPEPYRVWISEIMLQQTRVEAGKAYFQRFLADLPTIADLANVADDKLMKLWEGLGYYNRARNLKKAAQIVMEHHDGKLPADFDTLLTLPGIGEYTAGAIASIAFQLPVPCVDGNVLRVITRLTADDRNIAESKTKKDITEQIRRIIPPDRPGDFNQSLMELGALICLPNGAPSCTDCPLAFCCTSYQHGTMLSYPVKPEKKKRKMEKRTVLLIFHKGKVAIQKRGSQGLLADLFEFPNQINHLTKQEVRSFATKNGLASVTIDKTVKAKHIFSHVEWDMSGYMICCDQIASTAAPFLWVDKEQLQTEYALPSAFAAFYQIVLNHLP